MIKINLLTEVKQAQRKKGKGTTEGGFGLNNALIAAGLLIGLGYCGVMYMRINGEKKQLEEKIATAEREFQRLQKILEEVAKFEAKKANLQRKIDLINELKRNQKGPVRIMDEVSRMIPDLLWLDNLDLKGDSLTVKGRAINLNAVANFIDNLKQNPYFSEPALQDITQVGGPAFQFSLTFNFKHPEKKAADAGTGAKAPAPKP